MPVRKVPYGPHLPNPHPGEPLAGGFLLIPEVRAKRPFPPVEGVSFRFETPQIAIPGSNPYLGYAYEIINLQLPLTFKLFSTVEGVEKKGEISYALALYVGSQEIVRQLSPPQNIILNGEKVKWLNSTITMTPPTPLQVPQGQQLLFAVFPEAKWEKQINMNAFEIYTSVTAQNTEVTEGERIKTPGVINYRYI